MPLLHCTDTTLVRTQRWHQGCTDCVWCVRTTAQQWQPQPRTTAVIIIVCRRRNIIQKSTTDVSNPNPPTASTLSSSSSAAAAHFTRLQCTGIATRVRGRHVLCQSTRYFTFTQLQHWLEQAQNVPLRLATVSDAGTVIVMDVTNFGIFRRPLLLRNLSSNRTSDAKIWKSPR